MNSVFDKIAVDVEKEEGSHAVAEISNLSEKDAKPYITLVDGWVLLKALNMEC